MVEQLPEIPLTSTLDLFFMVLELTYICPSLGNRCPIKMSQLHNFLTCEHKLFDWDILQILLARIEFYGGQFMLKIAFMTFPWKSIQCSGSGLALNAAPFKVYAISAKINDISEHQGDISMVSNGCLKSNFSSITLGATVASRGRVCQHWLLWLRLLCVMWCWEDRGQEATVRLGGVTPSPCSDTDSAFICLQLFKKQLYYN